MVSNPQVMDNQRPQYIPPPPPPSQNNNFSHLPPPPPRQYTQSQPPQSSFPPPPPGPHPSALPPGTVFGIPGGWQQGWGRPGQSLPPPPPPNQSQNQNQQYGYGTPNRQPTLNIPPPPPQYDKPVLSATFIPGGDSFGPGVGIPPLDASMDYATWMRYDAQFTNEPARSSTDQHYSDGSYKPINYTYPNPAQPNSDIANRETRENRAASASSRVAPLHLQKTEAISPGPPTATKINPQLEAIGRQRAQSAAVGISPSTSGIDAQWPQERVLAWLSANGFSKDWQETFRNLKLEGASFLDLGRGRNGRGNLGTMHQHIYPQLARVTSSNSTGWDQSREREEGKRLRKLISRIIEGDGPTSAGSGHKRRESGMIPSASTEGTLENSPHMIQAEFSADASPGRSTPANLSAGGFGTRNSQNRSSTLPVFSKQSSSSSTPSEPRHPDSLQNGGRNEITRGMLGGIGRGRHSPNLSGDAAAGGLAPKGLEASPSSSPGLGHAVPTSAGSGHRGSDHSKSSSQDLAQKPFNYSRGALNIPGPSMSDTQVPTERFYEQEHRRVGQDLARPATFDGNHPSTNDASASASLKEHSKGFLGKFLRKRHDHAQGEDHALESPTSPGGFRQIFSKPSANSSDTALAHRPSSATTLDSDRGAGRPRRETKIARKFVFVTPDHWNYRLVDITAVDNPKSLRKLLCLELGVTDIDTAQVFYTEAGQTEHADPLTDDKLVSAQSQADSLGTLKIFVRSALTSTVPASGSQASVRQGTLLLRSQEGQPMMKSISAGGFSPNGTAAQSNTEALQKAADEYRQQTEAKRMAYLEQRQTRKDIAKNNVIDFDSPRMSPYEEKPPMELVPIRKPPTAPSASSTLTKVNSLRAKTGSGSRSSLDALKRISDPIAEERASPGKKSKAGTPNLAQGIGAALVNAGKMAGSPATLGSEPSRAVSDIELSNRSNSTGPSSRPSMTRSKGNMVFNVPDYDDAGNVKQQRPSKLPALRLQDVKKYDKSPAVSPSTERAPRPTFTTQRSYGPEMEFKETNVSFAPSPKPPAAQDDSDDDSDDGLFAIPLTNKSLPKTIDKPTLHLDTDQHAQKPKVAFKSPNSSGGVSITRTSNDESTNSGSARDYVRSSSDGSYSGSAMSPDERMGRRDSFVSDNWASRPAVENVVDNLDQFFPGVDLDKPFMEESADSPMNHADQKQPETLRHKLTYGTEGLPLDFTRRNESDTLGSDESTLKAKDQKEVAGVVQRQMGKLSGLGGITRMKSIRQVAQKRNDLVRGPSVLARPGPAAEASGIVRRKSTKMFGANIVQIKPKSGNRLSTLDPIPQEDVPSEDTPRRQATFKVIRGQLIGKGTYGRVYLGMNATTGDFLAVKQVEVNAKIAAQDKDRIKEMVAALDQEIDTMKDLEHPNIVQYLGCERKESSISIYLEYIPGGSVGSCLRKHGKFEESVVRSLTRQTLEGLAYLHQEGILHRDLKADNILLDLDGSCKISDFGISKRSDDIYRNDATNSMQGSVFWMAPEVVRSQGQGYSAKIDIWSLGCVVLEMFAGKRPWSREEAIGAIFKLGNLNQAPPIPDDVQQSATMEGLNFMYDCFQINPTERPTADILLRHSTFCIKDPYYNFYDTRLAAKLRNSDVAPLGG